jgi:hypothetical protein
MRGRPRKPLDVSRIATLRAAGLTTYQIAERMGEPQTTIWRLIHNSIHNSKIPTPKNGETCKSPVQASIALPQDTPPQPRLPQLDAHHSQFSVRYEGKQPVSLEYFHPTNNQLVYKFEIGGVRLLAHHGKGNDHALVAWIDNAEGDTPDEIEGKTRARARAAMAEIARRYAITPLWPTFSAKSDPHFVLRDGDLNDLLLAILREAPEEAKAYGILPGDGSHEDNAEFVPKDAKKGIGTVQPGRTSVKTFVRVLERWDAMEAALLALPPAVRALAEQNIRQSHELGGQNLRLSKSMLDMVKAVKGRMDTFEEREAFMESKMLQLTDAVREIAMALDRPKQQERRMET